MTAFFARRIEAMNRHDSTELSRLHAQDGVVDSPLAGGLAQGREAIERVYESFMRAFPDVTMRQEALVIDGDRGVLVARLTGTDSGGFMGLPPTNRSFSVTMVLLDDFKDGLIARERRIYDFTGLLVQLGVVKTKLA
jgi:steroid delta-isomerase-like uncharacterized protein